LHHSPSLFRAGMVKVGPLLYKADVSSAVLGVHHVITPEPLQEDRLVLLPLHQTDQGYRGKRPPQG